MKRQAYTSERVVTPEGIVPAAVLVDGRPPHPVSARALQARILDDLKAAGASGDPVGSAPHPGPAPEERGEGGTG